MSVEPTIEKRIELVKLAIGSIEAASERNAQVQADASSDSLERDLARQRVRIYEREFGWQWENVKAILEDFEARKGGR